MADDAQTAAQVKQALALLYATGNKEADTWLQGFITQGYGRCLGPCALILDDAASQPHEALFAATATHQTLRKMQLREVATQRSHVVMSAEGAVASKKRAKKADGELGGGAPRKVAKAGGAKPQQKGRKGA